MTLDYAIKLIHSSTSAEEVVKLEYKNGFNTEKTIRTINEAIDLVCEYARKAEKK